MIDLDRIEALATAATPGPWHVDGGDFDDDGNEVPAPYGLSGPDSYANIWGSGGGEYAHPDMPTATFIAESRTLVPALVAELRAARAEVERLRTAAADERADVVAFMRTTEASWEDWRDMIEAGAHVGAAKGGER